MLRVSPVLLAGALAVGGCNAILGIDDHGLAPGLDSSANGGADATSEVEPGRPDTGLDAIAVADSSMQHEAESAGFGDTGSDVQGEDSGSSTDATSEMRLESGIPATTDHTSTKDAYVRGGIYATTNFGTDVSLAVKSSSPDFSRTSWLTFDISRFASVTAAKLRLFVNSLDNATTTAVLANVFATPASSNGWGELTISWNNAPPKGAQIASNTIDVPNIGTWVEWDVTSTVQREIGGMSTLVIDAQAASFRGVFFSSRKGPHPPTLRITGY